MFKSYRTKIFSLLIILGFLSLIASILCATVFANKSIYSATTDNIKGKIVITKSGVLNALSDKVKVSVIADKKAKVQIGIGKSLDVKDYALYKNKSYYLVDDFSTGHTLKTVKIGKKVDTGNINLKSDMWNAFSKGIGKTSIKWKMKHSDYYAVIASSDTNKDYKLLFEWKVAPYNSYTNAFLFVGIVLIIIGIFPIGIEYSKKIVHKKVIKSIKQTIEFHKAVTQVQDLKVSQIRDYAEKHNDKAKNTEKNIDDIVEQTLTTNVNMKNKNMVPESDKRKYPKRKQMIQSEKEQRKNRK